MGIVPIAPLGNVAVQKEEDRVDHFGHVEGSMLIGLGGRRRVLVRVSQMAGVAQVVAIMVVRVSGSQIEGPKETGKYR